MLEVSVVHVPLPSSRREQVLCH